MSKSLPVLFPQHDRGKKAKRKIELLPWQKTITDQYPKQFIKGLLHSDGCRYKTYPLISTPNTERFMYSFTNTSKDISNLLE